MSGIHISRSILWSCDMFNKRLTWFDLCIFDFSPSRREPVERVCLRVLLAPHGFLHHKPGQHILHFHGLHGKKLSFSTLPKFVMILESWKFKKLAGDFIIFSPGVRLTWLKKAKELRHLVGLPACFRLPMSSGTYLRAFCRRNTFSTWVARVGPISSRGLFTRLIDTRRFRQCADAGFDSSPGILSHIYASVPQRVGETVSATRTGILEII